MPRPGPPRWIRLLGWHVRALVGVYLLEGWIGGLLVERHADAFATVAAIWADRLDAPLAPPSYPWIAWWICVVICAVALGTELAGWRRARGGSGGGGPLLIGGAAVAHLGGLAAALVPWIQLLRIGLSA